MKIHIVGASCAGSTTLGKALSLELKIPYFDTDSFFWAESDIPYTLKRDPEQRNQMLKDQLLPHESFIVGGSLVSWGAEWRTQFDLVVFLYVPSEIRLQRLVNRELERYGNEIYDNPERNLLFREFMAWASRYDDREFSGRNIKIHEAWIGSVSCPVIRIDGDTTVSERIKMVKTAYK